jgi:hypothetical protein
MSETNSSTKIPWSLAKEIVSVITIGRVGVGATVFGETISATEFGSWTICSAVVITAAALEFL